jgi:hypothetical protein
LDAYHIVLYIHFLALFVGVGAAAVMLVCLIQLRGAQTLEQALPWGMVAGKTEKAFPLAMLGLFGSGAYMTSDLWTWSTGWIDVSIAGLVVLALQGSLLGSRGGKQLEQALHANGPGPLNEHARRMARHPLLWLTDLGNEGIVFGIVWNMTQKPGTGTAITAVVVGYLVGAAATYLLTRPSALPVAAPETAA